MAVDLSGGIAPDREYVFPARPDDPDMRESVNAWIWDSGDEVGMPRIGLEAVSETWDSRDVQLNIAYPDGRVVRLVTTTSDVDSPIGADGKATHFGGGGLAFDLVEPFRHWRMTFDGRAHASTSEAQIAGVWPQGDPEVPVRIELDIRGAVPPWENGAMLDEARRVLEEQDEGALMGGPRYEQLSRATGLLRVGDTEHRIDGGALRIRRQGIRRLGTFRGHVWQSALFPSGKAFGFIVYPEREDGLPTYNEGYVFDGDGELVPAWVVEAPWLKKLAHGGQDASVVIATDRGTHRIAAETRFSCFMVMGGVGPGTQGFPVLQQCVTRYTWDGETANGMMERSMPSNLVET